MKKSLMNLLVVFIAIALFGCKSYEDYKNERVESAIKHFERAQYTDLPTDKVLSLKDCIELAIENNVDLKVYSLEEKVSHEMRTSEMLGMLPDLTVSDSYAWTEEPGGLLSMGLQRLRHDLATKPH